MGGPVATAVEGPDGWVLFLAFGGDEFEVWGADGDVYLEMETVVEDALNDGQGATWW